MSALTAELALESQIAVLGSMLIDPEVIGPLLQQLTADDFIEGSYRNIFLAIKRLRAQGKDTDPITVNDALGGNYRKILADLITVTPTSANAMEYADILRRRALQYHLESLGGKLADAAASGLDDAQAVVDKINALTCKKPGVRITSLRQCYEAFLDRHAEEKQPPYFTWGALGLDEHIYVEPGDFIVLGGYPSAGKTAMALQMCVHIAEQRRVGYFYYENNDRKLFDRLVALKSKVPLGKIKRFDLQEADFNLIVSVQDSLVSPDLEFIDASGMTAADVRALALSRHYELVVVDYLQKIPGSRERHWSGDFERVSEVSGDLQNLGRQTGVTVLALSQLTRPDQSKTSFPGMHSFRQSGQIEQDADVAMLLYREDESDSKNQIRTLKIAKNKEGEAGMAMSMDFYGATQTFSRVIPAGDSRATASHFAAEGRKARVRNKRDPNQVEFRELSGEQKDLPF